MSPPGRASRFRHAIGQAVDIIADALLPQACALCGAWAGRHAVCTACAPLLPRPPDPRCPVCADHSPTGDLCARCVAEPRAFDSVTAAFAYAPPIDELVRRYKFGHQIHLARWFGMALAERCAVELGDTCRDALVIPMPLHPARLAERGFNQAAEIARVLSRRLALRLCLDDCMRIRDTGPQARLPRAERHANMDQAFAVRTSLVGRSILLVDDVMTSGASVDELARTVRLHGANRVRVAVAARTPHA